MDFEKFIYSPAGQALARVGAGGLLAGAAGGLVSSGVKNPLETKSERRKRILKNTLLSGTVGAGATGLLLGAKHQFGTALPEDGVIESMTEDALKKGIGTGASLGAVHLPKMFYDNWVGKKKLEGILNDIISGDPNSKLSRRAQQAMQNGRLVNPQNIGQSKTLQRGLASHKNLLRSMGVSGEGLLARGRYRLLGSSGNRANLALTALALGGPTLYSALTN